MVLNKTFTYILPMLANNINEFYNLKGVFIRNEDYPQFTNHIFTTSMFHGSEYYLRYETSFLEQLPGFIMKYDADTSTVIHTYEVQENNIKNYNLIIEGKYSEISDDYKKHIIKFHKLQAGSPVIGVLYKLEYRYKQIEAKLSYTDDGTPVSPVHISRDNEISDPPYLDRETYLKAMKVIDPLKDSRAHIESEPNEK